jgi:ribonuclease HI
MKPKVTIFTDGSCPKAGYCGGWAYIMRLTTGKEIQGVGGEKITTNNRMELRGPIEALKKLFIPCDITLVCDSQYVTKGIAEWRHNWKRAGWKKKNFETKVWEDVANKDLWIELDGLLSKHEIKTQWVAGHAGHVENELCDKLAGEQTQKIIKEIKNEKTE